MCNICRIGYLPFDLLELEDVDIIDALYLARVYVSRKAIGRNQVGEAPVRSELVSPVRRRQIRAHWRY